MRYVVAFGLGLIIGLFLRPYPGLAPYLGFGAILCYAIGAALWLRERQGRASG